MDTYSQIQDLLKEQSMTEQEAKGSRFYWDTQRYQANVKQAQSLLKSAYGYDDATAGFITDTFTPVTSPAGSSVTRDRYNQYNRNTPYQGTGFGSTYDVEKYWGSINNLANYLAQGGKTQMTAAEAADYNNKKGGYNILTKADGSVATPVGTVTENDVTQIYAQYLGRDATPQEIAVHAGKTKTDDLLNWIKQQKFEGTPGFTPGGINPNEGIKEGTPRINPVTGAEEIFSPDGTWVSKTNFVVGTSDGVPKDETKSKGQTDADDIANLTTDVNKLTLQQQKSDLEKLLGIGDKPVVPTLKSDYEAMRSEYGIAALESRLIDINAQILAVEDSMKAGQLDEKGRLAPMEVITGRQEEIADQASLRLNDLQRSKALMIDELATKNSIISTLMNLTAQDYANTSNAYNTSFTQQLQLIQTAYNRIDEAEKDENAVKDGAMANLNLLLGNLSGKDWDSLDASTKSTINNL